MNFFVGLLMRKTKTIYSSAEYKQMKRKAADRFDQLCFENKDIPKSMKKHTNFCIFPAIAVYDTLLDYGMKKEDAVELISDFFAGLCEKSYKLFSIWLHVFENYHSYPANFIKNSLRDFGTDSGFEYKIIEKSNPAVAKFDIVKCPYNEMCKKYNCMELNKAFCDSDDAKYGNLHPNLIWKRTGTLGKGAKCCDFLIYDSSRYEDK